LTACCAHVRPGLRAGALPEQVTLGMMSSSSARAVATRRGLGLRADSIPTLATIDVPTLVMVGEHDRLTPPEDSQFIALR